ncbi:MAG TPA: serine protease [Myxococcaceae bacterium]
MLSLLLSAVLPVMAGAGPVSPEQVSALKASVVRIKALDAAGDVVATGSGFVIDPQGVVVTNRHVVDVGGAQLVAEFADGTKRPVAGILAQHPRRDVALVKIEGGGLHALELGASDTLLEGTQVVMVGAPLGLGWTVSAGSVSAIRPHGLDEDQRGTDDGKYDAVDGRLLQLDISSAQGASGSPVVDASNRVVGVISAGMGQVGTLVFAVPVEAVKESLEGMLDDPVATRGADAVDASARTRYRNFGVSIAFFVACGLLLAFRRRRPAPARRRRT